MAQSLTISGVARSPQRIVISGTAHNTSTSAQSITISGNAVNGQGLTISGVARNPATLTIAGTARLGLTISGFAGYPITLAPSTIAFGHPGSPVQTVAIQQGALSGPYTGTSSNSGVATATVSGTNVFVSAIAQGSATITITDANGASATAAITVGAPAGSVVLSSGALVLSTGTIAETTSSDPQTFTATRAGDTGPLIATAAPPGIVSVTGSGNAPGPVAFTVMPISVGSATITVSADDGVSASLTTTVTGSLVAVVTSPRHAENLVVAVSETNYAGTITPTFIGSTSATITPSLGFGPRTSFILSDVSPGELFLIAFTDANGNETTLSLQSKNVSLGPVAYTFVDETGINPVAPGSQYSIYYDGDPQIAANVVTSGFLGVGGTATLSLDEETVYDVVWIGQQAPAVQTAFTTLASGTTAQSVTVYTYRSPFNSTLGYAQQQLSQWTRGWIGESFKQPGPPGTTGNAYNLAYSLAAMLGEGGNGVPGLDTFLQQINVSTRLFNCFGSEIDSWFVDFLGPNFKRQVGETDQLFLARGMVAINGKVATRDALNEATNAAWKTLGLDGTIICDDVISNPELLAQFSLVAPNFVVLLPTISDVSDAFFLDYRYLGINTYLLPLGTAIILTGDQVPPLVRQAVESKRALGTIPIFAQYIS